MRRGLVTSLVAVLALVSILLAGCKGAPTPYALPAPTDTPLPPPTIPPPEHAPAEYTVAALSPEAAYGMLEQDLAAFQAADPEARADLLTRIEMAARELHGRADADMGWRAPAAWAAARAHHHAGDTDQSLAWLRPALLDSLNAGAIVLPPPPSTLDVACVTVEVDGLQDLDGDGADEWLLWLRFDSPPHESVSLVVERRPDGVYALVPAEGGWPQVGAGGTLLVEAVEDLNGDGLTEIAVSAYTCGDPGCAGDLYIFAWRGDRFVNLARLPDGGATQGIPLRNARWAIVDSDADGVVEINVVAPRLDTFGWGCRWDDVAVYEWDGAADVYTPAVAKAQYVENDPACLMTQADRAMRAGDFGAATDHLNTLLALPADRLAALGADFAGFARFRLGVAYALSGQPAQAIAEIEASRQSAFLGGLADTFLDNYRAGETPHAACAAAAYYAVSDHPPYDLAPVNAYGGLAPDTVCAGGQEAVQTLIRTGGWRTDAGPLREQVDRAGIPLLGYVEMNIDADADPEAIALTKTDFPFLWMFDADASGVIIPQRLATARRAVSLRVFAHDIDGDAAPEAFVLIEMRDPYGLRCANLPTATVLYVEKLRADGTAHTLLTATDCRAAAELEESLRADPLTITVFNDVGVAETAIYTYRWTAEGYAPIEPTPAGEAVPAYAFPTDAERAQLGEAKDALLEQGDFSHARSLLDSLLALPPQATDPEFRFEARYTLALWYELGGGLEAAREGYYQLWQDAPSSPWGELARRKLNP